MHTFCSNTLDKFSFWISIGAYGDVLRVKIMFKNKENALVQMADATQAQIGTDFKGSYGPNYHEYDKAQESTFCQWLS